MDFVTQAILWSQFYNGPRYMRSFYLRSCVCRMWLRIGFYSGSYTHMCNHFGAFCVIINYIWSYFTYFKEDIFNLTLCSSIFRCFYFILFNGVFKTQCSPLFFFQSQNLLYSIFLQNKKATVFLSNYFLLQFFFPNRF